MTEGLAWTPVKVGWLSGVSRPGTSALSQQQRAFVEGLRVPPEWKLWTNFPYGASEGVPRPVPLAIASAVNAARFLGASLPLRRASSRRHWAAVKGSCDRLLLITASCGSQIVAALERSSEGGAQVEALGLGAVDWGASGLDLERVIGSEDRLARLFTGGRQRSELDGVGHMDYARSSAALDEANRWIAARLGESAQ